MVSVTNESNGDTITRTERSSGHALRCGATLGRPGVASIEIVFALIPEDDYVPNSREAPG